MWALVFGGLTIAPATPWLAVMSMISDFTPGMDGMYTALHTLTLLASGNAVFTVWTKS